jgi:hypothetical protein
VVGVVVVAVLVGVGAGLLLRGGDDDEGGSAEPPSGDASTEPSDDDEPDDGTGELDGELTEDEPAATFPVRLEAGDALRVVVEGMDTALALGASEEALTDGFEDLQPREQELAEDVDAGVIFLSTDRSGDDVEGLQFVAPTAGTWTVVVRSFFSSGGEFDITIEVEPGGDEDLDPESIDYVDYLAHYGEHVDFFCDEDFFGGDPEDVTNYGPTVCDPETLNGVLAGQFSGDFTNDFGVED